MDVLFKRWCGWGLWLGLVAMSGACREEPRPVPVAQAPSGYVGAAACRPCHPEDYRVWSESLHARSMQLPSRETVRGDFTDKNVYTYEELMSRMFIRDGAYFMETASPDGGRKTYPVEYLIGDRDTQWYLTTLEGGRIQVLPAYYDLREGRWYDPREGLFDHTGPLRPEDFNFWANFGRNWNFQCFDCHASQIQKRYGVEEDVYRTRWVDLSINCEGCHGPGRQHVVFWEALPEGRGARDTTLVDLGALSPAQSVEVCAQCHASKRILETGYLPGDRFYDFYELVLLEDPARFWPDGRYRSLNYNTLAFMMSGCYTEGRLTCTGCHDFHHLGPKARGGAKDFSAYDQVCIDCHRLEVGEVPEKHSHHRKVGCVQCHMPAAGEVKRIGVYDHRISSPVPENTVRLGIPNACNSGGCHPDSTAAWSRGWVETWWGRQDRLVRAAEAVALGRAGDSGAAGMLLEILGDGGQSAVLRGTAASLLGRVDGPGVQEGLLRALDDPEPMVRSRAAESLVFHDPAGAASELVRLLEDPYRPVRMQAALTLRTLDPTGFSDGVNRRLERVLAEYQRMVDTVLSDDPNAHVDRGVGHLQEGDGAAAEQAFERALRLWRGMPDAYAGLGTVYARRGEFRRSVEMWQRAASRDTTLREPLYLACELWEASIRGRMREAEGTAEDFTALGDISAIRDAPGDAISWYRKALALEPAHEGARRNLTLVLARMGRAEQAREELERFRRFVRDPGAVRALELRVRELEGRP